MPIVNKTKRTAAIYNRGREVVKVYDHGKLAWQKQSSIPDYLCFTALEAGQFTLTIPAALSTNAYSHLSYIEWSKDGRSWNRTENKNSTEITIPVDVVTGDKVYWRGSGTSMTSASVALTSDCRFTSTARFNASGHLLSLLKLDDYDATTGWSTATFANLFYQSATLIDASGITLPALAAGNAHTFYGTFYECTNLVAAPDFNTSYTGNFMCFQMYRGCTSLTTMPKLPTTLSTSIFSGMFRGCTSLAITQPLNYSTLAENCFANMFNGCSSLAYVKCLATDTSASGCLTNWLANVSSTGTFIQAERVEWPRGASGIPTGWVDIEKRTMPSGYKQLLQVTSNGTAYIQLSFGFEETDEVAATFSVDTSQRTDKYIVCPQTWNNKNNRYGMGVHNSGRYTAAFGNRSTSNTMLTPNKYNDGELHNWTYAAATFAVTDKSCSINITGYTFGGITTNLRLFYGYNSNTKGAISSYKHIKGSTTACDFVAAIRESDNTAGLYDLANDEFMTCNGLTAGEEI